MSIPSYQEGTIAAARHELRRTLAMLDDAEAASTFSESHGALLASVHASIAATREIAMLYGSVSMQAGLEIADTGRRIGRGEMAA